MSISSRINLNGPRVKPPPLEEITSIIRFLRLSLVLAISIVIVPKRLTARVSSDGINKVDRGAKDF